MRQKADKLEKGKWYADIEGVSCLEAQFFRFEEIHDGDEIFSEQKGPDPYDAMPDGRIVFYTEGRGNMYLPTPEDIEKYNLNEEEK